MDVRKNFYLEKVVKHWNGQPKEVMESPSLEIFKRHVDRVVDDTI